MRILENQMKYDESPQRIGGKKPAWNRVKVSTGVADCNPRVVPGFKQTRPEIYENPWRLWKSMKQVKILRINKNP